VERIRELNKDLAEILETDASDVPQRLGSEESSLFTSLKWAADVTLALKNGLEVTIRDLREHWKEIRALPDSGIPGQLRNDVEESLAQIGERLGQENFYQHSADLSSALTSIKNHLRDAIDQMMDAQKNTIKIAKQDLPGLFEWNELTHEEQSQILAQLEALAIDVTKDLAGLKQLLGQEYTIQSRVSDIRKRIEEVGHERQLARLKEEKEQAAREGRSRITRSLNIPTRVTSSSQLDALIQQLQTLKTELALYNDIEVTIELKD
jgi:hypothetical protein